MTLAELDAQIAALAAQKQLLLAETAKPWPKRVILYAYTKSETAYEEGGALGLTGAALHAFAYQDELTLEYDVEEDGRTTLVSCNGYSLPVKGA